jgi:pilus assembly protein CpaF
MNGQFSVTVRKFLSPVIEFLDNPDVSEIMINSPEEIWVEKKGRVEKTSAKFESEEALMSAVNNISQFVQRRIDEETPYLDARLPDGSRVHVIIPPCARKGICLAIRKFSKEALTVGKLIDFGSITSDAVKFLEICVLLKKNILVSGGTGSGKTSLLNAISSLIPNHERIIVIEDSSELQLQRDHVLLLETKSPDKKGRGEVSMRDLLRSCLRLRPDRIIIGEIRGGETLDFLQALNTGHGGSMGTVHANAPRETLSRVETLTLFSGVDLPMQAIRPQVASAINIIVQTSRFSDGSRKITHISEVYPLDGQDYKIVDLFLFQQTGLSKERKILGFLQPTGNKPSFMGNIAVAGLDLPEELQEIWGGQ